MQWQLALQRPFLCCTQFPLFFDQVLRPDHVFLKHFICLNWTHPSWKKTQLFKIADLNQEIKICTCYILHSYCALTGTVIAAIVTITLKSSSDPSGRSFFGPVIFYSYGLDRILHHGGERGQHKMLDEEQSHENNKIDPRPIFFQTSLFHTAVATMQTGKGRPPMGVALLVFVNSSGCFLIKVIGLFVCWLPARGQQSPVLLGP